MALKFRRGTTAQQSGSLAFGEPYVNTTLGTLLVGGPTGDIVLSTSGTGSTGNFGAISGSGLDITGNANIAGNLTLGGTITIGDAATDNLVVNADLSSSIIPDITNVFDLGSTTKVYRNVYATSISGAIAATNGVVSGSSQVTLQSTTGFTAYNTALATITGSLITSASNDAISITNLNTFSGSQLGKDTTLATYTGSVEGRFTTLATTTGSLQTSVTNLNTFSGSALTRLTALEVETANLETFSSSALTRLTALEVETANLETFSGSQLGKDATLATLTASYDGRFTTLGTYTGSVETRLTQVGVVTGSLITSASTLTQRVGAIEAVSGTFARTNSANTFSGNQTISGSLSITQDLIVGGSSSIQNISSSNLVIGTAFVTLNTATPSSRFAGLQIVDSGSSGGSGSFLYDAVQDELIFVHRGNGTNVTSSVLLMGPQTYDNLGNETQLTNNRIVKSAGLEHIVDSQISDDGSTVSIPGALTVTGNITGPIRATNGVVSGSSQIAYASISSIPAGIVSGAAQVTPLLPTGVVSGSSQVVGSSITTNTITIGSTSTALGGTSTTLAGLTSVSSTGFTGALTGNASTATTLQTARTINGTSFNGSADITIPNLVSGSAQITAGSTTGFATAVKTQLDTNTVVSGSSQINATATTNWATGIKTRLDAETVVSGSRTISGITLGSNLATLTIGTGLSGTSYNGSTGVTIANTGVLSVTTNTGLSTNASATGNVTITNTGVTSAVAGTGVGVSGATGAVTISIGQAVGTTDNVRFGSIGVGMAASGTSGRIDAAGDIVAFSTSDRNFKENITPIENPIQKIRQISGNTYDWKVENKDIHGFEGNDVGVIAQEIEEVLPQLVTTRETGYKAVKYDKLVALLIEGIKEQQLQIEKLQLEVIDLKKQKGL